MTARVTTHAATGHGSPRTQRSGAAEQLAASFARCLSAAGTCTLYGMPGGGNNLDLIGACEAAGLRFVLVHGETAAAIMGAVDGDLSEAPGACLATRGPGAASLVNGVAHATLDRTPLAVITDAVSWSERARISHQRLDQNALFTPVTKWSGSVGSDGADAAISAALRLAAAPPPGAVHFDFVPDAPRAVVPIPSADTRRGDWRKATQLLAASKSPVIALGMGARRATTELRTLLAAARWPVLTTYKAKGVIPETWPNVAGLLTGATAEAPVLATADVIVAVGLDPVELIPAPWPYAAPVVALSEWHISDPYFRPRVELVCPLAEAIALVAEALPSPVDDPHFGRETRIAAADDLINAPASGIGPQHIVLAARAAAPPGTTATVDAGAHMLVAMPLWEVEATDEVVISSGLATMGFALPAAIAASLARPGRQVICFTGDGGLGMALAELETLARLGSPVLVVVFNDSALSLIEVKQKPSGHGGSNAVRYKGVDYAQVAAGQGIAARRVESRDELLAAFTEALGQPRPFLLDVRTDPSSYRQVMAAIRGGSRG